ncbi:MAG TPA: hypothetical protein VK550_31985 [Polyangiaceae bacterium]|jgi:hypothetical protein|nr:hypothetical protein [Polyangiaceae bacterium]
MPRRPNGPIEDLASPTQIEAQVITPGPDPHLHGFSVEGDLALNYRFTEVVQLALTGAPPDDAKGRAFDIALQFLAPLAIAEAPTHAAVLARLIGARTSSIVAVACIALAERARHVIAEHGPLLTWLETRDGELPSRYRSGTAEDAASLDRLQKALASADVEVPGLVGGLQRWTALLVTLHFAGLRGAEQMETVLVMASLAPTLAEALSHAPSDLGRYPINLPQFIYEEGP